MKFLDLMRELIALCLVRGVAVQYGLPLLGSYFPAQHPQICTLFGIYSQFTSISEVLWYWAVLMFVLSPLFFSLPEVSRSHVSRSSAFSHVWQLKIFPKTVFGLWIDQQRPSHVEPTTMGFCKRFYGVKITFWFLQWKFLCFFTTKIWDKTVLAGWKCM